MIKSASFHPMAELEMNEAFEYYEKRVIGLGNTFINEVERAINSICRNPESAPTIKKPIHQKILWRFPYSIIYSVSLDAVRILAVANQKRRPFYWHSRK